MIVSSRIGSEIAVRVSIVTRLWHHGPGAASTAAERKESGVLGKCCMNVRMMSMNSMTSRQ